MAKGSFFSDCWKAQDGNLLLKSFSCSSRGDEAYISSETSFRSEPPYVGSYHAAGYWGSFASSCQSSALMRWPFSKQSRSN
ncbi:MAG: hypothetical protein ACREDQ_04175, partial [Limisphaerales bacterium]